MTVRRDYEALRAAVPGAITPWAALDEQARADLAATVDAWRLPPETLRTLRSADGARVMQLAELAELWERTLVAWFPNVG